MASCCVSREVWIHSLLAAVCAACSACIPLLVAPGCTAWEACPSWATVASVRACERAPLHLCTRPVQVGKSAIMRRRGDVACVPP